MDSICFDFSSLHLIEGALPIWADKKKGGMRGWPAAVERALAAHSLNFITITVLRLNQFISGNMCPERWLGKPHSLAPINSHPFICLLT